MNIICGITVDDRTIFLDIDRAVIYIEVSIMKNNTSSTAIELSLAWPDWTVIGMTLIISAAIGVYYRFTGGRQKTADEYFFSNRTVGVIPLSITMMIAHLSGVTLLGTSAENYTYGAQFNVFYLGFILATPIVSNFYLPVFYQLKMMSVYEYLRRRFGMTTRLIASITSFALTILYLGVAIYAPALTLEATIGLDNTISILLIGIICSFYSSIGGVKAVILTDVLQGTFMLLGIYTVIGIAISDLNGNIWKVLETTREGGRLNFLNFDFDPTIRHTWWSLLTGGMFFFLSAYGCGQVEVQRMLSTTSLREARKALWMNIPLTLLMTTSISISGLVLYAYYADCDPVVARKIRSYDMVMPYFAGDRMTRISGLIGIFVAGVFSATLSTLSALLNSFAAVAVEDYVKPLHHKLGHEFPDHKVVFYGKILCVMIGIISSAVAFFASKLGNLMQIILAVNGALKGPILAIFSLGMFTESANEIGAITGMIVAIVGNLFLVFSPKPRTPRLPTSIKSCLNPLKFHHNRINKTEDVPTYFYMNRLSYLWISPISMFTALIIGYIVSFIVQQCSKSPPPILDSDLFTPFLAARIRRRRERDAQNTPVVMVHRKYSDS